MHVASVPVTCAKPNLGPRRSAIHTNSELPGGFS
jgi:hypothetical protein